ncbi:MULTISPECIES: hypothetical protein [Olivibacter]|jgi:hypothetical protein|uniref:Phenylalanyl-tRNA synthetase subunit beta n=2 Tax=Sphingobacteriaceae TaxID=84566 RepID=F4C4D5_SPHS2|nr:hypothetical protein [Olivibacter sp. 47]MCL4638267.1 hypothetical protein [Olivibacter sp. UJ_SKK_5.1]MDM8175687.1 hypothetical protein [Olivibacter sp. 47]MDX3914294.1 hypothetical protein [Pseudosphingobacterium sp.]
MSTVSAQLDNVVEKTAKLIELCLSLQEENDMLKLENQSIKVAFEASKDKNKDLEEKLKALTVARSLEGAPVEKEVINEKTLDIKQKINDFVREIDKCIELLK